MTSNHGNIPEIKHEFEVCDVLNAACVENGLQLSDGLANYYSRVYNLVAIDLARLEFRVEDAGYSELAHDLYMMHANFWFIHEIDYNIILGITPNYISLAKLIRGWYRRLETDLQKHKMMDDIEYV